SVSAVRGAFEKDPKLLGKVLAAVSDRLPYGLVFIVDQGEEVFTQARGKADEDNRELGLRLLGWAANTPGDFKVVISLRTEHFGRMVSRLQQITTDVGSVREYLLSDFEEFKLIEAIERPTLDRPIPHASEVPRDRYRFRYEPGVAREIAEEVREA